MTWIRRAWFWLCDTLDLWAESEHGHELPWDTLEVPAAWDEIERGVVVPGVRMTRDGRDRLRFLSEVLVEAATDPGDPSRHTIIVDRRHHFSLVRIEHSSMLRTTLTVRETHPRAASR